MALEARSGLRRSAAPELALPPLYTAVRLREVGNAFAHAQAIAAESGAGTLVYVGRFDLAEFAVVLEPEEPLRGARRALYAGMAALTDALAALSEPETEIAIAWPDAITVNRGLVGGGRLAWPHGVAEDEMPPWLVFGAMIRVVSMSGDEPGLHPHGTALQEEGFGDTVASQVVESFARHFMASIDSWQNSGFGAVARTYLPRLVAEDGLRHDLDDNGDLLIRRMSKQRVERKSFLEALQSPSWFDPTTGGPVA
jgi:biotin-(acetyl-CoA carboxylase) ligase